MQHTLFDHMEQLVLPKALLTYTPGFISPDEGTHLLHLFINTVPWKQHKEIIYGKEVARPRLSAWYGTGIKRNETKSTALPWTPELYDLKQRIELYTGIGFQSVLLNYYRDGNDSVAWHSDKPALPGFHSDIASLSIGQERNFDFRSKINHRKKHAIMLEHGSLLLMKADLQKDWEHRIARSSLPMKARINLTFRKTH